MNAEIMNTMGCMKLPIIDFVLMEDLRLMMINKRKRIRYAFCSKQQKECTKKLIVQNTGKDEGIPSLYENIVVYTEIIEILRADIRSCRFSIICDTIKPKKMSPGFRSI
eukprot:GHVR01164194.1.p2 GENE.GHVR01164194.1~~GHVR01164194.1.p2  ORF type:complete len:109 (-),score=0.49 GHVR01164194.1:131-457(-)